MNKRANSTQPTPSPRSSTRQSVRNASRTRSPRGRSPSGRMARLPCKDYLKGTCTNSFCEKWHPPECLFYKSENGCRFVEKCSCAHRQVDEQPAKYTTIGLHISGYGAAKSLQRICGRAQTHGNQSDVFNSQKPCYVMLSFETKIHRLE